jgi:hypothetical protein
MRLLCSIVLAAAASAVIHGQPAATLTVEQLLTDRLGVSTTDVASLTAGNVVVWPVPPNTDNEVAAAGAIRAQGDLRRIVAWLRDIEAFMRASGTVNVGAIANPAVAADFARLNLDDVDFTDLKTCRPGKCEIRMPASFSSRFQNDVAWTSGAAQSQAAALTRTLVAEYVAAYQRGGDAALAAFDGAGTRRETSEFQDLLRRSVKVWELSHPFVSYLETYPADAPAGTESRFYWTRDKAGRKPTLTLHHALIQELPGGRLLVADKQFYASRQIDAAVMIAFGVPNADYTRFDLVVSVKARSAAISGVAGRVLRGRIDKEMRDGLAMYLRWLQGSAAL